MQESVVLTAELRDELSAPLEKVRKDLDGTTKTVEKANKAQAASTQEAASIMDKALGRATGAHSAMATALDRATGRGGSAWAKLAEKMSSSNAVMVASGHTSSGAMVSGWDRVRAAAVNTANVVGNAASKMTSALGNATTTVGSLLMKGVVAPAAVATGGLAAMSGALGFKRLVTIDTAKVKLDALGNSTTQIDEIMKNASTSVDGTAFGLGDASTVAASSVAAGIKPGTELTKTLKLVADAASIAETDMGSMGAIFNKVAASGKMQGDVLAQLNDRGLPIMRDLGKVLGVTNEEVYALASKGKINFEQFQKAMEMGVGGGAAKMGNTFMGSLMNLKASIGRVGANFLDGNGTGGGFFSMLKPMMQDATATLKKFEPVAKVWGEKFGSAMGVAIVGIQDFAVKSKPFFVEVIGGMTAMVAAFQAGGNDVTSSGFAGFMERVGLVARFMFDEVKGGTVAMVAAFKDGGDDVTSSGFAGFMERVGLAARYLSDGFKELDFSSWDAFVGSLGGAGSTAGGAFNSIGDSLTRLAPAFQAFGEQLPAMGGALAALGGAALTGLVGVLGFLADHVDTIIALMPLIVAGFIAWRVASMALAGSQMKLQWAQVAMAPVMLTNTVLRLQAIRLEGQQVVTTTALTAAQNTNTAATGRGILATMASKTALIATSVATKAAAAGQWLLNAAMSANPIGLVVVAIAALQGVGEWFVSVWESIPAAWGQMTGFFADLWQAVLDGVGAFIDWAVDAFLRFHPLGLIISNWESITGFFAGIWASILEGVGAFIGWAVDAFLKFHPLGLIISNWSTIVQFFSDLWSNTLAGIGGFITGAVDFFTNLPGKILGALGEAGSVLLDWGKSLVDGLIAGVTGAADGIGSAIGGAVNGAKSFLGFSGSGVPQASGGAVLMAGGGVIPGYAPGVDDVSIIASRGEAVIVPELVREIGPSNIMALNHAYSGGRPAGAGPARSALSQVLGTDSGTNSGLPQVLAISTTRSHTAGSMTASATTFTPPSAAMPAPASAGGGRQINVQAGAINIQLTVPDSGSASDIAATVQEAVFEAFNELEREMEVAY